MARIAVTPGDTAKARNAAPAVSGDAYTRDINTLSREAMWFPHSRREWGWMREYPPSERNLPPISRLPSDCCSPEDGGAT
jgi:hypothetical protein